MYKLQLANSSSNRIFSEMDCDDDLDYILEFINYLEELKPDTIFYNDENEKTYDSCYVSNSIVKYGNDTIYRVFFNTDLPNVYVDMRG
jgi:hypothetical protein